MPVTIAVIGCLDTKGDEVRFMSDVLAAAGCDAHVIDTGVLDAPVLPAHTPREAVAEAGGTSLNALREESDRGRAVACMSAGAARVVRELYDRGSVQGVLAAGGSANTTIGTEAMRALPVGFPKVMVSTLASGNVAPYVGTKDITMMYSVADIAGINRISAQVLSHAARAVAAMAHGSPPELAAARPLIAATMFGVTTPLVTEARRLLEEAGYEVVVFHATGTGGRAMEGLAEDGYFAGMLDLTTTELADELVGGILSAGPRRLRVAGAHGIPQVVSVGAVDMVNFGPIETVPEKFAGRRLYQHNPTVTLMRTTAAENAEIGRRIASRLNEARGPVKVFLPSQGVSLYSRRGGPFYDPAADAQCLDAIREHAAPHVEIHEVDTDINDPSFAQACAGGLLALLADT